MFTFDPTPAVLFGLSDGKELTTREEKRRLFERLGIDISDRVSADERDCSHRTGAFRDRDSGEADEYPVCGGRRRSVFWQERRRQCRTSGENGAASRAFASGP